MTKPLREAESNGVRCRWSNGSPILFDGTAWRYATPAEVLDHAAVFTALREQPFAPEVDQVVEAIGRWHDASWIGRKRDEVVGGLAREIRPLVLASTPTDDLVGELVKRGGSCVAYPWTPVGHPTRKCVILPEPSR